MSNLIESLLSIKGKDSLTNIKENGKQSFEGTDFEKVYKDIKNKIKDRKKESPNNKDLLDGPNPYYNNSIINAIQNLEQAEPDEEILISSNEGWNGFIDDNMLNGEIARLDEDIPSIELDTDASYIELDADSPDIESDMVEASNDVPASTPVEHGNKGINLLEKYNKDFEDVEISLDNITNSTIDKTKQDLEDGDLDTEKSHIGIGGVDMETSLDIEDTDDVRYDSFKPPKEQERLDFENQRTDETLFQTTIETAQIKTDEDMSVDLLRPTDIIHKLSETIRSNIDRGKSEIVVRLKPEFLGKVILKISLDRDVLSTKIVTDSHTTMDILSTQLDKLEHSLHEHGYNIGSLDVDIDQGYSQPHSHYNEGQMAQANLKGDIPEIIYEKDNTSYYKPTSMIYNLADEGIDYFA